MKNLFSRALSLCLALLLTVSLLPVSALAASPVTLEDVTELSQGLTLTKQNARLSSGSLRQTFTLDYIPGCETVPLVLYGSYLNGHSPIGTVVSYAQSLGYTVLAAVNADFFSMNTGIPIGMTVQDGRLCTTDGAWNAVGFLPDGRAVCGTPKLRLTVRTSEGRDIPIKGLNHVRSSDGIYLYTSDFDPTTATTANGTEVVLQIDRGGPLRIGKKLTATVLSNAFTHGTPIGQDQLVLSLTANNTAGLSLDFLQPGETVTFLAETADPVWEDVVWGCGGGNLLAKNGALTADATGEIAPRTVLGVRADGSVRIIECDGRQSTLSSGISLKEAAQQLLNAGCVTVINLDGGGSSALAAAYPGKDPVLLSSPSEGAPRGCATYLVFVSDGSQRSSVWGSAVYPRSAAVLAGGTVPVEAYSYNSSYLNARDAADSIVCDAGFVSEGVFYAPMYPCTCTLTAGTNHPQPAFITVTDRVESLTVLQNGKAVTSLSPERGQRIDLDVRASDGVRPILCTDSQFQFSVTGNVGTVDENGVFTAGRLSGSGAVTVSYNGTSVSIPVRIAGKPAKMLDGFEDTVLDLYGTASLTCDTDHAAENVRYGFGALKLTYDGAEGELGEFLYPAPVSVRDMSHLTLCARGSGDWLLLFRLTDGTFSSVPFTAGSAWSTVQAAIPENADAFLGFAIQGRQQAALWLDRLYGHFGSPDADSIPPVILTESTEGTLRVSVTDSGDTPLTSSDLQVTVDGAPARFTFANGTLSCALPQDTALHRVTVRAKDAWGNLSRVSFDTGTPAPVTYSDLQGHWAASAVEYLHEKGVFSTDVRFNPGTRVSCAMAATMLSRYLGVDTAAYADVALPYTDLKSIPDWALPHVKAMYALGMIRGSVDSKGRSVFRPSADCTRAQIMTILGRTLERGYAYTPVTYADSASIPAWARDHVDLLSALGVVTGSQNKVNPNGTITRAEFAALLYRMY